MKSVLDYKKNVAHDSSKKGSQFFSLRNYIHFWEYNEKYGVFSVASSAMYQNKNKAMKLMPALTDSADSSLFFKDFLWKHIYLYPDHKEKPGRHQCDHHHSLFMTFSIVWFVVIAAPFRLEFEWEKRKKSAQNAYSAFILYSQRRQKMQSKEQRRTITSLCRI